MQNGIEKQSYLPTVRAAHDLAALLHASRPHLHPQVEALRSTITRTHARLDHLYHLAQQANQISQRDGHTTISNPRIAADFATALEELKAAHKELSALKHNCKPKA